MATDGPYKRTRAREEADARCSMIARCSAESQDALLPEVRWALPGPSWPKRAFRGPLPLAPSQLPWPFVVHPCGIVLNHSIKGFQAFMAHRKDEERMEELGLGQTTAGEPGPWTAVG